ncbi:MAG: PAS domain-containing protein [Trueperaceae bacterium]|nr:PAS domain-containing protein [Trueperaceae bacterium]
MFGLAVHSSGRSGSHGAGAFAAYSAVAGLRLVIAVMLPLLPQPWATGAGVLRHLTVWIDPLLGLLFALRFAGEARRADRWRAAPFWAVGAIAVAIVVTNPVHGRYLRSPWADNTMAFGPLGWGLFGITNVSVLAVVVLLLVAMARTESRRGPLALVVIGALLNWSAAALPVSTWSPFVFGQVDVAMRSVAAGLFAIALFGFGLLRLVPIGREAVLQRMDDGWLVLDPAGRIADLNPAAERLFGVTARWALGRSASEALRGAVGLDTVWRDDAADGHGFDARATIGGPDRHLDAHVTPLVSRHGELLGRTLVVRDVTALRRAEARALQHERAVATLQERERVARELHDGVAQVLGFVRLQAEAARGLLRRDPTTAETYLSRLADTALDAHGEVRAFIAGSAVAAQAAWPTAIAEAARHLDEEARLEVELRLSPDVDDDALAQPVAAHLIRIVQEALHNVRKHARAKRVTVAIDADDAWVRVVIADDGVGLPDPAAATTGTGFGLRFMHERAAAAGGSLAIASDPAEGTRVTVRMPRDGGPSSTNGASHDAAAVGQAVG